MNIIYNANILTMAGDPIENGYICFESDKIIDVGKDLSVNDLIKRSDNAIDANGSIVMPGLIDAHSHIGVIGDGLGFEGDDVNECNDPVCSHLSSIDSVNPMDRCFTDAVNAGITSVCTGPGSADPISGRSIAIKTYGKRIDSMILKSPCAMKMALGENPKTTYHSNDQLPETRMSIAATIREALSKAARYAADLERAEEEDGDKPDYDAKCEALLPCLDGSLPVHFHAHRADDIFTAIRIAKEFNLCYSIVHCTEGHMIADELKDEHIRAMVGPIICDRSKPELMNQSLDNAAILSSNNIKFAIISDHPEVPCSYLLTSAAIAVKHGLDRTEALKALTIFPAEILGISDRVGSIEIGKDADIVIFNGDPLNTFTEIKAVFINGRQCNS